jgi:hypothetical protein
MKRRPGSHTPSPPPRASRPSPHPRVDVAAPQNDADALEAGEAYMSDHAREYVNMRAHPVVHREHRARRAASLQGRRAPRWLPAIIIGAVLITALNVRKFVSVLEDYHWLKSQVGNKQLQLAALDKQQTIGKARLAELTADKGREELLLEHGYIPPGERILLFPPDPQEQRAAAMPKNDLSPHPPSTEAGNSPSLLRRAGRALSHVWSSLVGNSRANSNATPPEPAAVSDQAGNAAAKTTAPANSVE